MSEEPRIASGEFISSVADEGSFRSWDGALPPESVITGEVTVRGRRVAVIVSEFGFMGGSIGVASADRIVAAVERATVERLPIVASPASGGTRMSEGTPAFVAMIDIAAAVHAHQRSGLPYLVYLRHPTMGGVLATWGSMGHLTLAQPRALIGLIGPRIHRLVAGAEPSGDSQRAEAALRAGQVDAVVPVAELRPLLSRVLELLEPDPTVVAAYPDSATTITPAAPSAGGWDAVLASRRPERPGASEFLAALGDDAMVLHGTGDPVDAAVLLALARFGGQPCLVVAQDRHAQRAGARPGVAALGLVVRATRLAADLSLPLVTLIDTPGVAMGPAPEEPGLAAAVGQAVTALLTTDTPVVSVLLGQGGGAAALALFPADRRLAAENAWLAALPPEAASALVHRDPQLAADIAREQRIGADELLAAGVVDRVVPEFADRSEPPEAFCARLADVITQEVQRVLREPRLRGRRGHGARRPPTEER